MHRWPTVSDSVLACRLALLASLVVAPVETACLGILLGVAFTTAFGLWGWQQRPFWGPLVPIGIYGVVSAVDLHQEARGRDGERGA